MVKSSYGGQSMAITVLEDLAGPILAKFPGISIYQVRNLDVIIFLIKIVYVLSAIVISFHSISM